MKYFAKTIDFVLFFLLGFFLVLLVVSLTGCGGNTPAVGPDGQPIAQQGPGIGTGAVVGGILGYMLGRSASRPAAPSYGGAPAVAPATVVNRTVINKTIINKQMNPTVVKPPVPSYTKPPSFSQPARVPSYSRPSSSFRSGRR